MVLFGFVALQDLLTKRVNVKGKMNNKDRFTDGIQRQEEENLIAVVRLEPDIKGWIRLRWLERT